MIRQLDERTLVSGQIGPDDVARLKDQGVTMIVCNRPDGEEVGQPRAADIEQAANEAGIEFRFAPIIRGIGPSEPGGQHRPDPARGRGSRDRPVAGRASALAKPLLGKDFRGFEIFRRGTISRIGMIGPSPI